VLKPFQMISNPFGRLFPVRDRPVGMPHSKDAVSLSFLLVLPRDGSRPGLGSTGIA
jgi:hypothetical protein